VKNVKLESLQPGMVVAADVRNLDDMLLIPSGCTVTPRHLEILQAWGVAEVRIEDGEASDEVTDPLRSLSPEELARLRAELCQKFLEATEPPPAAFEELLEFLMRRRMRALRTG
jgi:hypothetical protein